MDRNTRNALIAAAVILGGFALAAFFLPAVMLRLGEISPYAAGAFGLLFILAFFLVFYLRARSQRRRED